MRSVQVLGNQQVSVRDQPDPEAGEGLVVVTPSSLARLIASRLNSALYRFRLVIAHLFSALSRIN